jgi:hypothetical protein
VKSSNRCQNVVWNSTTASVSFWRNTWKRISIGWVPSSILPVAQLQEPPDLTRFQRSVHLVFLRLSQHESAIELLSSKEISSRNNHAASETHLSLKRVNLRCRPPKICAIRMLGPRLYHSTYYHGKYTSKVTRQGGTIRYWQ